MYNPQNPPPPLGSDSSPYSSESSGPAFCFQILGPKLRLLLHQILELLLFRLRGRDLGRESVEVDQSIH